MKLGSGVKLSKTKGGWQIIPKLTLPIDCTIFTILPLESFRNWTPQLSNFKTEIILFHFSYPFTRIVLSKQSSAPTLKNFADTAVYFERSLVKNAKIQISDRWTFLFKQVSYFFEYKSGDLATINVDPNLAPLWLPEQTM